MEGGGSASGAAPGKVEREEAAGGGGDEEEAAGCRVWGWGAGSDGQLGIGSADDQLSPRPVQLLSSSTFAVSHIACGGAHAIALTGDGSVLTWGRGTCGQLGHGELGNCSEPKTVEFLKCFKICHVSAGWNHSGFVTDTGDLFTCGDGSFGQLGHGDCQSCFSPKEVTFFGSMHVMQIACGLRHSLALIKGPSRDIVFGFGSGKHGQLGPSADGIKRLFNLPKAVCHFENDTVATISANGDQSAALTVVHLGQRI
uniref:Putative E3 ubiquitin-protein ligase HERC3 n=1 Tax=Anthurium amnicola TaxID=1678845 RepID=A0A1D1XJ62_9ARAE